MKKNEPNIVRINPWRIIKIFAITFVIFEAIFYLSFQGATNKNFWPLDRSFYFYTPALFIATIVFAIMSITQTFYEIEDKKLIHNKMGKIVDYSWSNIIYIDEDFSERKKMMRFFTNDGVEHLLTFDKNGEIYKTALNKCRLISREEFCVRYPNTKM